LRQLREGYGFTLRKVEEQALAFGEAIDNSQLSRFEKGKALPSFDKLRALARVFNVPVQNFSDVLDLEEYEAFRPTSDDFDALLKSGADLMVRGEHGRAFVTYERALEVADTHPDPDRRREHAAEARWRVACALKAMGKLLMSEHTLREILKHRRDLPPRARLRSLLQLTYLYRELGDLVLAKECRELANSEGDLATQAGVLNTLGNIEHDEGQLESAREAYGAALEIVERLEGHREMTAMVQTNLGGCLVALGRYADGMDMLRQAHSRARREGFRRAAALALTRMAEAAMQNDDSPQAREKLAESDGLASRGEGCFHDILFLNAFHRWSMARGEGNGTGEKIAFGRLRHLRSQLQRRFPEVDEFDRHVERTRR
jgi:tetratricopeptide (TPR) repeat protein